MMSTKLPLWLRFFLLIGVAVFAAGAGLLAYRYYTRPATLTVAVGSIDGEFLPEHLIENLSYWLSGLQHRG
jgi:hypothetical protein